MMIQFSILMILLMAGLIGANLPQRQTVKARIQRPMTRATLAREYAAGRLTTAEYQRALRQYR
ncbi:hypothetical protein [Loigolactobacillus zhaoyuanensis]|uniref:SHOCT domain-containing protein n=1 Tax=Loigolactobacillus zhaoyuanensis TaxID=2486017 RepID=A0ABW8UE70_9LACO|nr:hypothetical protein [Loigolactobacillus zhaoyuanensis]